MLSDDRQLTAGDIQSLSTRDAVAALFATLGWNVDERLPQTPAALGITAESLIRQIRHVEQIAVQDDWLHVYLFEMRSVRVADRQALARSFGNRGGDFLLVLTSDYDTLDFVLLKPEVPTQEPGRLGIARAPMSIRTLTVDRRSPGPVDLRVLRRFTYTEHDAFYQVDKLLSAYAVAEWSQPLFNNRNLFSDYYLMERLKETAEWREDPRPAYRALADLLADARSRLADKVEAEGRQRLIEPALAALGFRVVRGVTSSGRAHLEPDYYLRRAGEPGGDPPLAMCLAYAWNRNLDGPDPVRDPDHPAENPGARVVSLLANADIPWAIVTNGKTWRLYSAKAHSRATNYYEIELDEALHSPDRDEAIRYYWLFFRAHAFVPQSVPSDGEVRQTCFLDRLVEESEAYAKQLGERLKDRIFEEVFPHLARGFIEHIRQAEGKDADIDQERLDAVYQGTLTLLYRVMFLLYAEARGLLPVREVRGYWERSLGRLKGEIADKAGNVLDDRDDKLKRAYSQDSTDLYDRLTALFGVIDRGDRDLNVPRYNGGLFHTEPDDDSGRPEVVNARFLNSHKVPDRYLALGLDRLARDLDDKTQALVAIDFKSLGVRQLGSIYEGLLEFKVRIAPEKMAIVKGKRTEEIIPYSEAKRGKRAILTVGRGKNKQERTLPKGTVYLENTRQERKATGSYYTPDYIVKYIVEHTVGPVLDEKLETLRPRLREGEKLHQAAVNRGKGLEKSGRAPDDPEKVWNREEMRRLAWEVLDVKVLDPAMGSGHFLVEAVDFITDRMLRFLDQFPRNPVYADLRRTREAILSAMEDQGVSVDAGRLVDVALLKRQVLKRCVYGVDLNPMAVELAKVSLWLDAFTLGAPLSFLDHHLRWGNSLIGTMAREAEKELQDDKGLWTSAFTGILTSAQMMRGIGALADATMEQVQESIGLFHAFEEAIKPYKQFLDLFTVRHFGVKHADEFLRLYGVEALSVPKAKLGSPYREVVEERERLFWKYRFFNWDLEFPEVFIDLEHSRWKQDPGFDAVVGNPPWVDVQETSPEASGYQRRALMSATGKYDQYVLFVQQGLGLLCTLGMLSLITPSKFLVTGYGEGLRGLLAD